jgi:hypothetical protein
MLDGGVFVISLSMVERGSFALKTWCVMLVVWII